MWIALAHVVAAVHGQAHAAVHGNVIGVFVTTSDPSPREVDVQLDVAAGFAVTGMTVTLGGATFSTALLPSGTASYGYHRIVDANREPALLEHVDRDGGVDHLLLRVFPVQRGAPVRVVIGIHRGTSGVSPERSLLASWPELWPVPSMLARPHVAAVPPVPRVLVRDDVDRIAREHGVALGHCFELAAAKGSPIRTVPLVLRVARDGRVREAQVSVADTDVRACIADQVLDWRFDAIDSAALVRYSLRQ